MPKYDRDEAIKYAKKWCNDHNPNYPNFDAMGENNSDYANFVSQCMHEGGKMPMKFTGGKYTKWYYRSLDDRAGAWADCQSLRLFIKSNETEYPRMPYSFLSNSQVNMLEPGDVVFELEDGAANNKPGRKAKHVSLVSRVVGSKIYVYSHSKPKNDEEWKPSLSNTILCHFTGEILTEGSDGGSSDTSSWEKRYGTALLKKSNTYNAYVENLQTDLISLKYNVGPDGADGYYGDNNQVLSTTTYNTDGTVQRVDYGNEDSVEYSYDEFKRTKGVRYNWDYEDRYVYEYGANGQVAQLTNTDILTVTTSEHDAAGRPARITRRHLDTGAHLYTGEVSYDEFNNLKTFKEQVGSDRAAYTTTFTHDNENRPTLLNFGSSRQVTYVYDGLGRISRRTVNAGSTGVATTYGYLAGGHGTGSTTPLVQTITQSGTTLTYDYDDAGNITSVSDGSKTISYEYDLLGQLTRVNDPYDITAGTSGTTWKYAYDKGGNIQSKTAYAFTTGIVGTAIKTDSFTYGDANWKDKLTAFNGQTITYDEIGNPTNDGTWNYTWIGGRQMRAMYKGEFGEQGYDEITFEYNENGLRTKKTRMYYDDATGDIGYKATNYTLHGKNIVHLSEGSNDLHFFYDAQNKPAVVIFNGTAYAYLYNLQGDVIGLVDSNGTKMVSYTYDAWGKPISKSGTLAGTLGTIQPFRYRGYVFDEETGLYYLRTRYYSSDKARFVNGDKFTRVTSPRLAGSVYAYCRNTPTMMIDSDGFDSKCYLKAAYYIGSYLVSKEEYEAYASFLDAYRTTIGNSNAMLPTLYENEGCFDIKSVSYRRRCLGDTEQPAEKAQR